MANKITLLGVKGGPAVRQSGNMPTANLIEWGGQKIILDCGVGVTKSAVDAGLTLRETDAVFITHLHSDHVLSLGSFLYTAWTTGLNKTVRLFGPVGIKECWDGFLAAMSYDRGIRMEDEGRTDIGDLVEIEIIDETLDVQLGDLRVTALRVDHPPVTECYALKFEDGAQTVVFSSDTCFFPPLIEFSKGADILIHEAMLTRGVDRIVERTPNASRLREHLMASHTPADQVGLVAAKAGVGQLILNHLVPSDDDTVTVNDWEDEVRANWDGPLRVGVDGMVVDLK